MNIKYIALAVVAIAITSVGTITIATNSAFAIENNQVTSQVCGSESEPSDAECQNTTSQIQGNEHAVSLASQQTFEEEKKEHTPAPASQQSITPSIVLPH
jgi:hypothetical protein